MKKTILYLREIGAGLDSGMTIQVLNDYGHLSHIGNEILVPVHLMDTVRQLELKGYMEVNHFAKLTLVFLRSGIRKCRLVTLLIFYTSWLIRNSSCQCVVVLRERKYLLCARLFRFFFGIHIVSELHEGGLPLGESKSLRLKFQRLFDKVDGVVFTNFSQVQYLRDRGYTIPKIVIVLPNGVDVQKFSCTQPADPDSSEVIVTYAGQFTSWKNLPLLFESLRYLPPNFRLRIAGGKIKGEASRIYIEDLKQKFGVESRVDFLGFVHPEKIISQVLSGSSVLALPLDGGDIARFATSPMKLVEYMATPIPIVAVAAPSVLGLAGTDTIYLSEMNARDFADAIRKAIADKSNVKQERIARANLVAKQYDHKARAARYDRWLSGIILNGR